MLHITAKSYDESNDSFTCVTHDDVAGSVYDIVIPATLMPYIAADLVADQVDLPFDIVGKSFTLTSHLCDIDT